MSYYILPKNNNTIIVNPCSDNKKCDIYISYSLYNYYNKIISQLISMYSIENNNYYEIIKMINPYEYIFSKVPGSQLSVSKLKTKTMLFYDIFEIITTLNILEPFKKQFIRSLHITPNYNDTIDCIEMYRENNEDMVLCFCKIDNDTYNSIHNQKFDFLFFEASNDSINNYITNLIEIYMIIIKYQINGGVSIIKINETFHKPVIDILYLLTSLFENIYLIKPNTSNITTFEKYIVCKNFIINNSKSEIYKQTFLKLSYFLKNIEDKNIVSIIDKETPYYFMNKIDDINIIIGQQQLESLNQIINMFKSKNNSDKIETLKKFNIQKSVNWCEKFKIPCNTFSEKTNIFLSINKEIHEELYEEIDL